MTVKPFWNKVTVIESPVDEIERGSGLIVPQSYDGNEHIARGVVISVGVTVPTIGSDALPQPNDVIYYDDRHVLKLYDVRIVDLAAIVAVESDREGEM